MQAALKPLRLVKNQPASELETLFQAHHGRVFRTAQRITGSAADAEDVLQTVFLRLVRGQDDYDWSGNPEAYLSRAAINASLDLLRIDRIPVDAHTHAADLVELPPQPPEEAPVRWARGRTRPELRHERVPGLQLVGRRERNG